MLHLQSRLTQTREGASGSEWELWAMSSVDSCWADEEDLAGVCPSCPTAESFFPRSGAEGSDISAPVPG